MSLRKSITGGKTEMPQLKLILTVGLPRSGKSTWARKQGFPIVNPDSIRLALHGEAYIQEAEDFVWATTYLMANALFIAGHYTVIIDATNYRQERRQVWVDKFPDVWVDYKEFKASKDECIARAKSSDRDDLVPIIERMSENLSFPNDGQTCA